jgi:hypothetical protein
MDYRWCSPDARRNHDSEIVLEPDTDQYQLSIAQYVLDLFHQIPITQLRLT